MFSLVVVTRVLSSVAPASLRWFCESACVCVCARRMVLMVRGICAFNVLSVGLSFNPREFVLSCIICRTTAEIVCLHDIVTPLAVAGIQQLCAQEYGQITRMLGNGRCDVQCVDGVKRLHISICFSCIG